MTTIGTPFTSSAKKVLFLGSGELGKEVVIELQRLGCEVVACDRYDNAPAMQVADRSYTFLMTDGEKLREVVEKEKPDLIVPEIEAIATAELVKLEHEGYTIVPTARAAQLTMNRQGIRDLVVNNLGIKTSPYQYAKTKEEFNRAVNEVGLPCVVKPVMSSSGKGQSTLRSIKEIDAAWDYAQDGGRTGAGTVIVEGFIEFDYEITLLTVRHSGGTSYCEPIGHLQEGGDYKESWQPQAMHPDTLEEARRIAKRVTDELGGYGIFGVELFVRGDLVIFSEVSPRPHDTGLVTLISQDMSQFALYAYAILGLPISNIHNHGPSASAVIMANGNSSDIRFHGLDRALSQSDIQIRLFGKPEVQGERRMGVVVARGLNIEQARTIVRQAAAEITVEV